MREKKRINNTFDLIMLVVLLVAGIYFLIEMWIGKLIPLKYILGIALFLIVVIVGTFFTYKVKNQGFRLFRKVYLIALSVLLMIGSIFQGSVRSAFSHVNGSTSKMMMYVIALKEHGVNKLEDVEVFAHLNQTNEFISLSLEKMKNYSFETVSFENVEDELNALNENVVDAVLISGQELELLLKDKELDFEDKYKKIHSIEVEIQSEKVQVDSDLTQPFVVYVSGLDSMGEPTFNGLSDVNMLLMVDPVRHHVEMVSVNRDTYVPNEQYDNYPDKLTHLGWQGPEAGAKALEKVFGIEIDYTVKVTFESLIKIIDTLGGIDVDVKLSFSEQDEYRSKKEEDLIHLEKGYQHLNGREALAYARHRKTAGWDVKGREQAQRDIVKAVVKKVLSIEGALKVGDVLKVGASYVSTNLSMDSVKGFMMNAIDQGAQWSFGSSTIKSDYEFNLPTATGGNLDLSSVLLEESDARYVHDLYLSMFEEESLNDFSFDLNDLYQGMDSFEMDPSTITVENYYEKVGEMFPDYLRYPF